MYVIPKSITPPFKRLTTLIAALVALAAPMAVQSQTECTLKDVTLNQVFPPTGSINEGRQAIIGASFPTTCPVSAKRLMVCLDLWDTTACPPGAPPSNCEGRIRGSNGFLPTGGLMRTSGPTVCNREFLTDPGGSIQHQLNFLFTAQDDSVKADRQNYFIVHTYNPYQVLRIPIVDDD